MTNLFWVRLTWFVIGGMTTSFALSLFVFCREDHETRNLREANERLRQRNADAAIEIIRLEAALEYANDLVAKEPQ